MCVCLCVWWCERDTPVECSISVYGSESHGHKASAWPNHILRLGETEGTREGRREVT